MLLYSGASAYKNRAKKSADLSFASAPMYGHLRWCKQDYGIEIIWCLICGNPEKAGIGFFRIFCYNTIINEESIENK